MVESRDDRTVVSGGSEGGFGSTWIIALLFMAIMPMMMGGVCGNRGDSNAEINGRFNSLENQVQGINTIAETRATHDMACRGVETTVKEAGLLCRDIEEGKYQNAMQMNGLQNTIQGGFYETARTIDQSGFANQRGQWEISKQLSES